jgi:hypothetical protein
MSNLWQKRRSEFNHDWLKNQYMPTLATWINLLDGRIEDFEYEDTFVANALPQWELHRGEASALAEDFEQLMSPRQLFSYAPLSHCDEDTKQWLGDLTHALWLSRCPVKQLMGTTLEAIESVNEAYKQIQEALRSCPDTKSARALRVYRMQFSNLRERCQDLADAISAFPREIVIA